MKKTKIEWCDTVWNPVWGCRNNCSYCYARRFARRMGLMMVQKEEKHCEKIGHPITKQDAHDFYEKIVGFEPVWVESNYARKFSKKPLKIFVNSMSDPVCWTDEWGFKILHHIKENQNHTFLILTKHPSVYLLLPYYSRAFPNNLWLGVTVTNQKNADEKIPVLLQSKAAVRFVSIEPMMGPVDLRHHFAHIDKRGEPSGLKIDRPNWIILGGMTGPGATPMHPDWVRSVRDQCKEAAVPFFFKSWGEYGEFIVNGRDGFTSDHFWIDPNGLAWHQSDAPTWDCVCLKRVGKSKSGNLIDGVQYHEFPA